MSLTLLTHKALLFLHRRACILLNNSAQKTFLETFLKVICPLVFYGCAFVTIQVIFLTAAVVNYLAHLVLESCISRASYLIKYANFFGKDLSVEEIKKSIRGEKALHIIALRSAAESLITSIQKLRGEMPIYTLWQHYYFSVVLYPFLALFRLTGAPPLPDSPGPVREEAREEWVDPILVRERALYGHINFYNIHELRNSSEMQDSLIYFDRRYSSVMDICTDRPFEQPLGIEKFCVRARALMRLLDALCVRLSYSTSPISSINPLPHLSPEEVLREFSAYFKGIEVNLAFYRICDYQRFPAEVDIVVSQLQQKMRCFEAHIARLTSPQAFQEHIGLRAQAQIPESPLPRDLYLAVNQASLLTVDAHGEYCAHINTGHLMLPATAALSHPLSILYNTEIQPGSIESQVFMTHLISRVSPVQEAPVYYDDPRQMMNTVGDCLLFILWKSSAVGLIRSMAVGNPHKVCVSGVSFFLIGGLLAHRLQNNQSYAPLKRLGYYGALNIIPGVVRLAERHGLRSFSVERVLLSLKDFLPDNYRQSAGEIAVWSASKWGFIQYLEDCYNARFSGTGQEANRLRLMLVVLLPLLSTLLESKDEAPAQDFFKNLLQLWVMYHITFFLNQLRFCRIERVADITSEDSDLLNYQWKFGVVGMLACLGIKKGFSRLTPAQIKSGFSEMGIILGISFLWARYEQGTSARALFALMIRAITHWIPMMTLMAQVDKYDASVRQIRDFSHQEVPPSPGDNIPPTLIFSPLSLESQRLRYPLREPENSGRRRPGAGIN